jgi:hypothetical protein
MSFDRMTMIGLMISRASLKSANETKSIGRASIKDAPGMGVIGKAMPNRVLMLVQVD